MKVINERKHGPPLAESARNFHMFLLVAGQLY